MTDHTTEPHSTSSDELTEQLSSADPADAPDIAEQLADKLSDDLAGTGTPPRNVEGADS
ncbi:MAG: hypothetical protein GWP18_03090 [Proteobacteria bacterium]|nr:hypothetical protein [Pseudomonadota bacterium]